MERSICRPTAFCIISRRQDSNLRPQAYETCKLTNCSTPLYEARQQSKRLYHCSTKLSYTDKYLPMTGIEPVTHGLQGEVCLIYGTCL